MYKDIFKLLGALKTYIFATTSFFLILIGLEAFGLIKPGPSIFANAFFMSCLAYVAHQYILTGGKAQIQFNVPELIRFLGMVVLVGLIASALPLFGSMLLVGKGQPDLISILLTMLLYLIVSTGIFFLIGTAIPAHVAGHKKGLKAAFKRGRADFWSLIWDFVRGPVAFSLAFGAIVGSVVGIVGGFVSTVAGVDVSQIIVGLGLIVLLAVYYTCSVVAIAYILCQSYMRSLAREELAIGPSD